MSQKAKPQAEKFKEAARELGCDESEKAFDDKLRVIAKQKPREPAPKESPPGGRRKT